MTDDPEADALGEFRSTYRFLSSIVADLHADDIASFVTGYVIGVTASRDRTIASAADSLDVYAEWVAKASVLPGLAGKMRDRAAELRNPRP